MFQGKQHNGTYTFAYLEPGTHLLWTNWTRLRKEMDLIPGQVYYIEIWSEFNVIGPEEGQALIEKVGDYATPKPRELATADEQIRERYGKALRREQGMNKAQVEVVEARPRPADATGFLEIPAYTEIPLELMENVTSYLNPTGDSIWLRVSSDVVVNNQLVVSAGTPVRATMRHSAKGAMGGVGGNFDIVVPAVQAVDGSLIPLLGRLDSTGKRRTAAAVAAGTSTAVVTGLATGGLLAIAVFFPRGKEAFLLVGEEFKVWTKDSHWIDGTATRAAASEAAAASESQVRLQARAVEEVKFLPQKRRVPTDLQIILNSPIEVKAASIHEIGGWSLPTPLESSSIAPRDNSWSVSFGGWSLVRHARLVEEKTVIPVKLKGMLADGRSFFSDTEVTVLVKGTD